MHWLKSAVLGSVMATIPVFIVMAVVNALAKRSVPVFTQIREYVWG